MLTIHETAVAEVEPIMDLLQRTGVFTPDEVHVARELLEDAVFNAEETTYRSLTAIDEGRPVGYILFGETPVTIGTYDLYWMAVDPGVQGKGIGRALVVEMERRLDELGGRLVRVETAGAPEYAATRAFYDRIGYPEVSCVPDFYWPGNALHTYIKRLRFASGPRTD